jgi:hypothetical protein
MKRTLIQLVCAAAVGVLASSAQAVTTTTSTPPPQSSADLKAQADSSYAAAKSICEAKGGTAKRECLRNAKADYNRWLRTGEVDEATATVSSGTGAGGAGSTKSGNPVVGAKH